MKKMIIQVDEKLCKGCYYCVDVCPNNVLDKSDELSPKGYYVAKAEKADKCNECRLCERICPDFAISVNEEENS